MPGTGSSSMRGEGHRGAGRRCSNGFDTRAPRNGRSLRFPGAYLRFPPDKPGTRIYANGARIFADGCGARDTNTRDPQGRGVSAEIRVRSARIRVPGFPRTVLVLDAENCATRVLSDDARIHATNFSCVASRAPARVPHRVPAYLIPRTCPAYAIDICPRRSARADRNGCLHARASFVATALRFPVSAY